MIQFSVSSRNSILEAHEIACNGQAVAAGTGSGGSVTGSAAVPKLRLVTGAPPADCATAQSGSQLAELTLPADWASNASAGSKAKNGTWSGTASAGGTAGYYRIVDNAGTTCHEQGTVGAQVVIATNALTAANGNVLNFASTTGAVVGMNVAGTGVPVGATAVAVTGTTVTLSMTSTAGVANAASITFTYDMTLDNPVLASTQAITINTKALTAPNA